MLSSEIEVVGTHAFGGLLLDPGLLTCAERSAKFPTDLKCDLGLDREYILQFTVIGFCPEVRVGLGINELRGYPKIIPSFADNSPP